MSGESIFLRDYTLYSLTLVFSFFCSAPQRHICKKPRPMLTTEATVTGIFLGEAARTILEEDDLELGGGIYTAACLGEPYLNRLDKAGFRLETEIIPA